MMQKSFCHSVHYRIDNKCKITHKKALISISTGYRSYTEISEIIVALQQIQTEYATKYGLNN